MSTPQRQTAAWDLNELFCRQNNCCFEKSWEGKSIDSEKPFALVIFSEQFILEVTKFFAKYLFLYCLGTGLWGSKNCNEGKFKSLLRINTSVY